jgi:sporulation protein YlmC with PRC-barrel domain
MVTDTQTIQQGMDVFDTTGEKIGTIGDIYTLQATNETSPMGPTASQGSMIKVNEGGVLGIGAKPLYVPFSAVQTVTPGDSVTLNCTKSQAETQYSTKPEFIDDTV